MPAPTWLSIVHGVTGGGKAVKAIAKASEVGKVSDGAKAVYKAADKANDIRKATGSYEIIFEKEDLADQLLQQWDMQQNMQIQLFQSNGKRLQIQHKHF